MAQRSLHATDMSWERQGPFLYLIFAVGKTQILIKRETVQYILFVLLQPRIGLSAPSYLGDG